jgi:hypothetical protein
MPSKRETRQSPPHTRASRAPKSSVPRLVVRALVPADVDGEAWHGERDLFGEDAVHGADHPGLHRRQASAGAGSPSLRKISAASTPSGFLRVVGVVSSTQFSSWRCPPGAVMRTTGHVDGVGILWRIVACAGRSSDARGDRHAARSAAGAPGRAENLDRCRALIEADPRPSASASDLRVPGTDRRPVAGHLSPRGRRVSPGRPTATAVFAPSAPAGPGSLACSEPGGAPPLAPDQPGGDPERCHPAHPARSQIP